MATFDKHPSKTTIKTIICGDSGSGKTAALASLANAGYRLLIVDIDGGLDILRNYLKPEAINRVHYATIPTSDPRAYAKSLTLLKHWKVGDEDLGPITSLTSNDVFVIDSASLWTRTCLDDIIRTKSGGGSATDPSELLNIDIRFYAVLAARIEDQIATLTSPSINCNIILNVHLRQENDTNGNVIGYKPDFAGRMLTTLVPKYFNNMWRIDVARGTNEHKLRTQSDHRMMLKCSAPNVIKPEEPLNLADIFRRITNATS